jgi:cytochrome c oxidase subunit 1
VQILAFVSEFWSGGAVDTGWTFYVPFSLKTTVNVPMATFSVFVLGMSSILTGINVVTTVHQLRAPGMRFFKMPLSVWGFYSTAWVQILATPIVGIKMILIIMERFFGIGVFDPSKGGDPLLYQHLFWIYSHPAVYIMILPAMGVISDIIPVFSRKNIYGYKMIAFSSIGIASVGSLVWGHHMFTSGQSDLAGIIFSLLTFLVAIPSAIKVFNWIATMYKGSIRIEPPFLYALSFIFLFSIGGLGGLFLGALSANVQLHNTYFVVGHFHYMIFGGMGFGFFAGLLAPENHGENVRQAYGGRCMAGHFRRVQPLLLPYAHHGLGGDAEALRGLSFRVQRPPALSEHRIVHHGYGPHPHVCESRQGSNQGQ